MENHHLVLMHNLSQGSSLFWPHSNGIKSSLKSALQSHRTCSAAGELHTNISSCSSHRKSRLTDTITVHFVNLSIKSNVELGKYRCKCCLVCAEHLLGKSNNIFIFLTCSCHFNTGWKLLTGDNIRLLEGLWCCGRASEDVMTDISRVSLPGEASQSVPLQVSVVVTLHFLHGAAGMWSSVAKPDIGTQQVNEKILNWLCQSKCNWIVNSVQGIMKGCAYILGLSTLDWAGGTACKTEEEMPGSCPVLLSALGTNTVCFFFSGGKIWISESAMI